MTPKNEHPEVRALAARYDRAKARYEELRDELKIAVVNELRTGARPADLSRASGWDREYLRRIKDAADKADALAAAAEATKPAPAAAGGPEPAIAEPEPTRALIRIADLSPLGAEALAQFAYAEADQEQRAALAKTRKDAVNAQATADVVSRAVVEAAMAFMPPLLLESDLSDAMAQYPAE